MSFRVSDLSEAQWDELEEEQRRDTEFPTTRQLTQVGNPLPEKALAKLRAWMVKHKVSTDLLMPETRQKQATESSAPAAKSSSQDIEYVNRRTRRVEPLDTPLYFLAEVEVAAVAAAAPRHRVVFPRGAFSSFDTFLCPRQLRLRCRATPPATGAPVSSGATAATLVSQSTAATVGSQNTARGITFEDLVIRNLRKEAANSGGKISFLNCNGSATSHQEVLKQVLKAFAESSQIRRFVVAQLPLAVETQTANSWKWWKDSLESNTEFVELGAMYPDIVIFERLPDTTIQVSIADIKSSPQGLKRGHCLQIAFYSLVLKELWSTTTVMGFKLTFSADASVWLDPEAYSDAKPHKNEFGYAPTHFPIAPQEDAVQAFLKEVLGPLVAAPTRDMEDVPAQRFQPGSACGTCEYRLECKALARRQKDSFALCARPAKALSPVFRVPTSSSVETLEDLSLTCPDGAFADEVAAKLLSLKHNGKWIDVSPLSVRPLSAANCVKSVTNKSVVVVAVSPNGDQLVWQPYGQPEAVLKHGTVQNFLDTLDKAPAVVVWNNAQANALIEACRTLKDLRYFKALSASFDGDIATGANERVPRKALLRLQDVINSVAVTACPFTCLDIDDLRTPQARAQVPIEQRLWTAADMAIAFVKYPDAVKECFGVMQSATEILLRVSKTHLRSGPSEFDHSMAGIVSTSGPAAQTKCVLEAVRRDAWLSAWSTRRGTSADKLPPAIYQVVEQPKDFKDLHWVKPTSLLQLPSHDDQKLSEAIFNTYACVNPKDIASLRDEEFLTRPYWAILIAPVNHDNVVDVPRTLEFKKNLDGTCFTERPLHAAHVLGYRITQENGVELLIVIDLRGFSLEPSSCRLLLAARSHDFNHEAIYSAVCGVAARTSVSVVENLCQQAPAALNGDDQWQVPDAKKLNLNQQQLAAVTNACTRRLTILWGPPGTGKTSTLSALLHVALALGKRVLVTTLTHAAKKELLEKMKAAVGWAAIKDERLREVDKASVVRLANTECPGYVIFATPQGINKGRNNGSIKMGEIQLIVIDEASQMSLPLAFLATSAVSMSSDLRVVVAGDVLQLPPILPACLVESHFILQDRSLRSITRSVIEAFLFDRAGNRFEPMDLVPRDNQAPPVQLPEHLVMLNVNYRSCSAIVNFVARLYKGLTVGSQQSFDSNLPPLLRQSLSFIGDFGMLKGDATLRSEECHAVVKFLTDVKSAFPQWSMAVVTPHRLQRITILGALSNQVDLKAVQVDTVERMQGQEFDVVVIALASVSPKFALQLNRLNVALSRAKHRVLVVSTECLVSPSAPDEASLSSETRVALSYLKAYWENAAAL